MIKLKIYFLVFVFVAAGCSKKEDDSLSSIPEAPVNLATPLYKEIPFSTDKSIYAPGEEVTFIIDLSHIPASAKIRYKHLNSILEEKQINSSSWKWIPPKTDYKGYMVEIFNEENGSEIIYATTAVDVSSSWKKFPRYGFLSKFPQLTDDEINSVIENLNKYHINGLQFYDWHNKHHKPLPMVGSLPAISWKDIINRDIYFSTIERYIAAAHGRNMKTMFYNLIYGTWDSGEADGVNKEWYVFTDNTHTNKDFHPLPSPFLSNLYLVDPSIAGWQQYLIAENKKVYQHLAFDGFHMDQLGERKPRYLYDGTSVNLNHTFLPFISAVKASEPQKDLVMNAVNQYGQEGIASSPVDFLYTEVWSPYDSYNDLANLIKQNNILSNNTKNTVLAAYMNYKKADNQGTFNIPSVLMANAVIFAFGGAHLELGEHMLGKEYFPNNNLKMNDDLKNALVDYYDFLVAYQNVLRDGGFFNSVALSSSDNKISLSSWPGYAGKVSVFGKKIDNKQVIHLINLTNAQSLNWRDDNGVLVPPALIQDAKLVLTSDNPVKNIWVASPDIAGGTSRKINFAQQGDKVSFSLPELKYWDMIVVEY